MRQENNEDRMKVYLIGAGPGDPGLLTIKGKDILEKADVVVYDYLANDTLLGYARPDAERIYVGKVAGNHALPQDRINKLKKAKSSPGSKAATPTSSAGAAKRPRNCWTRACRSRKSPASPAPSRARPMRASP